jgi:formate--tetrahydrofolate ligase
VAINAFKDDPSSDLEWLRQQACKAGAAEAAVSTHHADGGKGSEDLARSVRRAANQPSSFSHLYELTWPTKRKIETITVRMYGASRVSFEPKAELDIDLVRQLGYDSLPICMAKTPLSLSHDPALKGRPTGFTLPIKEVRLLAGARFLTAVCSGIQLMPGLPKRPAGERIGLDPQTGRTVGLS